MGRTGYDTTNFRNSGPDPNNPPPRKAGMGLITPPPSSSSQDPKGEGKERADTPSGSAVGAHQAPPAHLPPVRRSADFRETVIEPFPVLPQSQRQSRGFGFQVGPRGYGAGGGNRPRALEIQTTGGKDNSVDVEMGGTTMLAAPGPSSTGAGTGIGNDVNLKTPRASHFVLPGNYSRDASRFSQQPQYFDSSASRHQAYGQYPDGLPPPPPPHILRSQASQFGLTTNKSSSDGNGNSHTQSHGLRSQPFNSNTPPSVSSKRNAFASDTAEPPRFVRSGNMTAHQYQEPLGNAKISGTGTGAYAFGTSDARDLYMRTVTPHPDPWPMDSDFLSKKRSYPQDLMTAAGSIPRAAPTPGTTATMGSTIRPPPGFNIGPGSEFESGPRLEDRSFPFFPQPATQAEKDRQRKATLDAGYAQLLAKRQKRHH
ncbi:uncharacterized protein B0T23DRAFT_433166 [Neurospora hispaniola]|uniref:Uncharacterized protein n=1 Tax=Neurospora hispaniola TaxID=588809 RepID=A0AAJ0HZ56_9PEZI|nr:hypothetical protein B0T23DRAFT_433166 [Neurospora hispaniola]